MWCSPHSCSSQPCACWRIQDLQPELEEPGRKHPLLRRQTTVSHTGSTCCYGDRRRYHRQEAPVATETDDSITDRKHPLLRRQATVSDRKHPLLRRQATVLQTGSTRCYGDRRGYHRKQLLLHKVKCEIHEFLF